MTQALHQIELDQDTRLITVFESDTRIKRFKRLIFGVFSAAEELQHALQTILADIPGTNNIADDIAIFAENTKKQDEKLARVLQRCDFKNINLNLQKSVFCKSRLKYYDFIFSEKVMKPHPENIQEIRETSAPENRKIYKVF